MTRQRKLMEHIVLVDGWQVDRMFDGPKAAEEAETYAAHCNRNYQGHHEVCTAQKLDLKKYCGAIKITGCK